MFFLLKPLFFSFLCAAFFLSLRLWIPSPLGLRLSFLALPLGFLTGLSLIPGGVYFPPKEGFQWVFLSGLLGGVWPFVFLKGELFSFRTFLLRFITLSFWIYFLMFWLSPSLDFPLDGVKMSLWFLIALFSTLFWMFSERVFPPRLFPAAALLTSISLSLLFLFAGSLRLSQMMGCFCAVLGLASLWNVFFFSSPVGLNVIPLVVMVFLGFLVPYAHFIMFPLSVFFIICPFWIGGLFCFLNKKGSVLIQSFLLCILSFPFLSFILFLYSRS